MTGAARIVRGVAVAIAAAVATATPFAPTPVAQAATDTLPPIFALDPHAGLWVHGPDLPEPRQAAAVAVLAGRIYVVGGFGADASPTNTTFVLEPAAGADLMPPPDVLLPPMQPVGNWTVARPIPEAVDNAAAASLDGYLYVAGGTIERLVTNKAWRYDPVDDTWSSLPPLPIPRYDPTMQAIGGRLYLVGGSSSHGNDETSIEMYDPATASWSIIGGGLAVEREASRTAVLGGRIVVLGGRDRNEHDLAWCDLFDPTDRAWSSCSAMRQPRSGFGLAAVGDRLLALGGVDLPTGLATQTTEISSPYASGWMDGHWLPAPSQGMGVAVLGHTVWVIGGSSWEGTSPTDTVLRYVIPMVRVRFGGRAPG